MPMTAEQIYIEREKTACSLALALVDAQGVVRDVSGAWHCHGYHRIGIGDHIDDAVDVLVGVFPVDDLAQGLHMPLIERSDGHYIEVAIDSSPCGILITAKDVTESASRRQEILHARNDERLANAALERIGAELGQALAALRRYHMIYEHEVRNAAQIVQGSLEMLRLHLPALSANEHVLAASASAMALVDALNAALEVEKSLASRGHSDVVPSDLVRDLEREFRPLAQLKGLRLDTMIGTGSERRVALEPFRLRLALINLLGNAIKFTRHGTIALAVATDVKNKSLVFTVKDTGPGIEQASLNNIIDQRQDSMPIEGRGLGLFICNQLTRSMRGHMEASSAAGQGTCIQLIFAV